MATFDVILPVHNGIAFLAQAVDSILAQSFTDWRLFILNHASTDGSFELAEHYQSKDVRIHVHSYSPTISFSELLNKGVALCDGKYVLRLDADDICYSNRMAVLDKAFHHYPDVACIGSVGDIIDEKNRKTGVIDMPTGELGAYPLFLFRVPVAHPSACFRTQVLKDLNACYGKDFIGVLPQQSRLTVSSLAEDYFLFGQLALVSRCMNLPDKLIGYRWHKTNVSVLKQATQLQMALLISRYLANSLSAMYNVPKFDPAPFCNHGERLYQMTRSDFRDTFFSMRKILEQCLPKGPHFSREMAFRELLANRQGVGMLAKFTTFALQHGVRQSEWRTVKSWQLRHVQQRLIHAA